MGEYLFQSEIVNTQKIRNYTRRYDGTDDYPDWKFLILFLAFVFIFVAFDVPSEFIGLLWGGILVNSIFEYFYLKPIVIGQVFLNTDELIIDHGIIKSFKLSEIDNLEITRGSRWHYSYEIFNETVAFNNFISFQHNGEAFSYEFMIRDKTHNREFEAMINRFPQIGLAYKSV